MIHPLKLVFIFLASALIACGGKEEKKEPEIKLKSNTSNTEKTVVKKDLAVATIDLSNKGIGPVRDLVLPESIDTALAARGEEIYKTKCAACHKPTKKFIGPAPLGVLERRSPEWVMNMILNPEEMTQKDPIARALLIEYNGSPMANQSLTEDEARAILEYFRTLKPD